MASPFTVKDIGTNKHATADYAILNIIIPGLNHEGRPVKTIITKKAHIVKGLKAKILIRINVMGPKEININMAKKTAHVGFYDVNIPILTKPHARNPVSRVIYIKSTVFIPFYSTAALPIHHIQVPSSRDFLFEPFDSIDLSLYAYLIDASLKGVLTRNNTSK